MTPTMSRRGVVRSLAWWGAGTWLPVRPVAALPSGGAHLAFRALRNGAEIGWHRVDFRADQGRLTVDIEIRFDVTFAFLTLYRYRHRSRETWQGSRLLALDAATDDDGDQYRVRAHAAGGRLIVETAKGDQREVPATTLPTSYWQERTIAREQWLDTQGGRLARATVQRLGSERITAAGRAVPATRYRLRGDLNCEIWYHERQWSKLRFVASDGSTVDYRLEFGEPRGCHVADAAGRPGCRTILSDRRRPGSGLRRAHLAEEQRHLAEGEAELADRGAVDHHRLVLQQHPVVEVDQPVPIADREIEIVLPM